MFRIQFSQTCKVLFALKLFRPWQMATLAPGCKWFGLGLGFVGFAVFGLWPSFWCLLVSHWMREVKSSRPYVLLVKSDLLVWIEKITQIHPGKVQQTKRSKHWLKARECHTFASKDNIQVCLESCESTQHVQHARSSCLAIRCAKHWVHGCFGSSQEDAIGQIGQWSGITGWQPQQSAVF